MFSDNHQFFTQREGPSSTRFFSNAIVVVNFLCRCLDEVCVGGVHVSVGRKHLIEMKSWYTRMR